MRSATLRTLISANDADEDDRGRRRDRACVASGLIAGAVLGAFAGFFVPPSLLFLTLAGTVAGGVVGRLVAFQISVDDWDPSSSPHSYVGAASPDDDFAS
jgi:hypothetical protein